jgi:hypothetical protein
MPSKVLKLEFFIRLVGNINYVSGFPLVKVEHYKIRETLVDEVP